MMTINKYKLGDNIHKAYKSVGMTQWQLAEQLDVGIVSVSRWVNGHKQPTLLNLIKISLITGTSVDELLEGVVKRGNAI